MDFSLFDPVFFIWLGFLGVIIPIFTFGVSLTINAIEKAKEKIERDQAETEKEFGKQTDILQKELEETKSKNLVGKSKGIEKELNRLYVRRNKFEKDSAAIMKRYNILNFKDSVLMPGFFFICAMVFSVLIKFCVIPVYVVITSLSSLLFLSVAIHRVGKCLKIIRDARLSAAKYEQERISEVFHKAFTQDESRP